MKSVSILGFDITAQGFDEAIERLLAWSQDWEQPRYALFTTAYTLTMGNLRDDMRQAILSADMLPADGMPLVWLQRHRGQAQAERIYAPDVMEKLCEVTATQNITHYFWGGAPEVTEKLVKILQARFPRLQIAGYYSPPFAALESEPKPTVIERINAANPHIVWVCLGSVKQDLWMSMYRPYLKAPLLMSVGAAFNFLSGTTPQAPKWIQRLGFEWLFRLLTEPRRLGKRYIVYNPIFVFLILREIFLSFILSEAR
ncbi:MAG: WecB/TagA/CpsF family glycosyltransferase [Anaerolineae bacterium]|nr:WecB/TagA/CpsF family glycosyltransferase [Anaerolineae bacterium]